MPQMNLVVLGAGRPTGFMPVAKAQDGLVSLPWVRAAVRDHVTACHFVAGYAIEETAAQLEGFSIEYNPRWQETGSVASLLCAPLQQDQHVLASYADVVFRQSIVARLAADSADIAIAIDSRWRARYDGRTQRDLAVAEKIRLAPSGGLMAIGRDVAIDTADAEFAGLVRLSAAVMHRLHQPDAMPANLRDKGSLTELIAWLVLEHGFSLSCHDVEGDWAELNAPQDLSRFVLGTKAETLDRLRPLMRTMRIEDQVRFTVNEWDTGREAVMAAIGADFSGAPVIVRSSAHSEDGWATANAGVYTSIANVDPDNSENLAAAIEEVINSYGARHAQDQVLVQPMLQDVVANGVLFTRTLSHGAPYFVVNYDETPGCTDAVTAGTGNLNVLYVHHDADKLPADAPDWAATLIAGGHELVDLVGYDTLDMEFAVGATGEVHMLQLRPIAVDHTQWVIDDALLRKELEQAAARFQALETLPGNLGGGQAVFGVMPDWNPAEIIGTRPSLLSSSLYRYLICDEIWARQRAEYGYHDVRPQPLLVSFAGHPYVNVRASFRSFVPASIPEPLAERLVDHYLTQLIADPALHDKVEFHIVFTCLSFDFYQRAEQELVPAGFSSAEIETLREGLAEVTRNGIARYAADLEMVEELAARFRATMEKSLHPLERACALLEDCRRFGTLPFAHLARGGFVAVTLMRSAVDKGFIDQSFVERYMQSISTVAKEFVRDGASVTKGALEWENFLDRYGHLRPGTYDITSPAYRDQEGKLLREAINGTIPASDETRQDTPPQWPDGSWQKMQAALSALGVEIEQEAFERFVRAAIEGREYAKFVFSRNLSQAIDDLAEYGNSLDIGRETLAAVPLDSYFSLRAGEAFGDPAEFIRDLAEFYEKRRMLARNIELPPLIHDPAQFFAFIYPPSEPNFITSQALTGQLRYLSAGAEASRAELSGKIVVISQADPGFDWLFGCDIAGLVTEFGGANSHMAIRAAEFGTPAAIGVGGVLFEQLQRARQIRLDCLNRRIDIVQ